MKANREPHQEPSKNLVKRLVIISIAINCCFALLMIQFYRLQILQEDEWKEKAEKQHYFTISEPFRRGVFYANTSLVKEGEDKKVPLVVDLKKYHLYIDQASIRPQ